MDWWQTFFDDTYLKMYRDTTPTERTEREIRGILAMLNLPAGASVLDLCCGQGRHCVRLAQAGMKVTGFDLSPHLLAAARRSAEAAGVDLTLVEGDMRNIPFQGEFDAIVNLFTAFGYFDDTQNQGVLHGAARALKPGGQFLIDVPNVYFINARYTEKIWFESDLGPVMQEHTWDPWTGRDRSVFYWTENSERRTRSFDVRSYTSYEMIAMLRLAGLAPVKLYGRFDMSDYRCQDSQRLIVLAKKDG